MTAPAVVLVEPAEPGNVGTVARAMKNFGLDDLRLIDPPAIEPDGPAYGFAGHARDDILPNAERTTLDAVVDSCHTIGFTAYTNEDDRKHVRYPFLTPEELPAAVEPADRQTALVFGRERVGLSNDELARLDEVCSIPASAAYPTLNLGQAATIACYAVSDVTLDDVQQPETIERAAEDHIERCYEEFAAFLTAIDHPDEKRAKTGRLLRRVLGRAHPTGREVSTLIGVFRRGKELASADTQDRERPERDV
jgi:tRNA (cytidine32/uridine32-2'-O)-methyltransferase